MAKYELKFIDNSDTFVSSTVSLYEGMNSKEIHINIFNEDLNEGISIFLDKSTAIKFAKTLRTEINKITE